MQPNTIFKKDGLKNNSYSPESRHKVKDPNPELSVIIVNWNTKDYLIQCLESIAKQNTPFTKEIIVVDNASSDGSAEAIHRLFPEIKLIESAENLGFAKANNLALAKIQGNYVLLLNPDTILHTDALTQALERIKQDQTIGILGVKQLEQDGTLQPSCGNPPSLKTLFLNAFARLFLKLQVTWLIPVLFRWFRLPLMPVQGLSKCWDPEMEHEVGWIMGAFLLMPSSLAKSIGLFDERFTMFAEDMDLGLRVLKLQKKILYFPKASITHFGGASTAKYRAEADAAHYQATIRFYQKHHHRLETGIYRLILGLSSVISFIMNTKNADKRKGAKLKLLVAWAPERFSWPPRE